VCPRGQARLERRLEHARRRLEQLERNGGGGGDEDRFLQLVYVGRWPRVDGDAPCAQETGQLPGQERLVGHDQVRTLSWIHSGSFPWFWLG
jgi:hypothetical protein